MRVSGVARAWVQALCFVVVACGSRIEVLDDTNPLKAKNSSPQDGGVKPPTWTDCDVDKLAAGHTGEPCTFEGACSDYGTCRQMQYNCQGGVLTVGEINLFDCDPTTQPQVNPVGWTTCSEAMASGHLGDTCVGAWSCTTNDDDPCCIDFAYCEQSGLLSTKEHTFAKTRFCQKDCSSIREVTSVPPLDACVPPSTAKIPISGTPCTGAFACSGSDDVSDDRMLNFIFDFDFDLLYWCRDGVLQSLYQG